MLVLSRQRDESIIIGDNVQVTIVDIRGDKVRLGIVAPSEISVHRKEVYDAIQRENKKAANAPVELPPGRASPVPAATPQNGVATVPTPGPNPA
jgi:carbon storage regulator